MPNWFSERTFSWTMWPCSLCRIISFRSFPIASNRHIGLYDEASSRGLLPFLSRTNLRPKYWTRTAPRSMGDIFFAPISAGQAPRGSLALLGHVRRAPTPPAGILPAWKRAAAWHMAITLAPEAPGNLDMLPDAAVHPPHPQLTEQSVHRRSAYTACTRPRGLTCPARYKARPQPSSLVMV